MLNGKIFTITVIICFSTVLVGNIVYLWKESLTVEHVYVLPLALICGG